MSYRGTIAIREGGVARYFGTGIDDPLPYLFWPLERLKEAAFSSRFEFQRLNTAWDESGLLADEDEKQLLYFGGESDWEIGFRQVLDAFLEYALWPGWDVRFCPRHLVDFGLALGVERTALLWRRDEAPDLHDLKYWIGDESRIDGLNEGEIGSLLMVRRGGQDYLHTVDSMYVTDILDHGEELIAPLSRPGVPRYVSGTDGDGLCSSALIDCDERRLTYWYVDEDRPPEYFERFWPGWELVDLADDYRAFSRATDGAVSFDETVDMDRAIRGIRACNRDDYGNPTVPEDRLESLLSSFRVAYG